MKRLMILNGPNLNLLGVREPHIYGTTTLSQVRESCEHAAKRHGIELSFHQSNHEGEIVDWIQSARQTADAIIINPAGYSFTSIAILDAIKAFEGPVIEVHISNIHARDELHRHSKISHRRDRRDRGARALRLYRGDRRGGADGEEGVMAGDGRGYISESSRRKPGPITTGRSCCAKALDRRLSQQATRRIGPGFRRDDRRDCAAACPSLRGVESFPGWCVSTRPQMCNCTSGNLEIPGSMLRIAPE